MEGKGFAKKAPRQGTEITERSPWIPLCALWSHGSTIPRMKGCVNPGLNFLIFTSTRCLHE
jgi:hypothetical protein